MNTKTLMKYIACQLPKQGINMQWTIRGEIGTEEVDENKNLLAVCHCGNQTEIIYSNFTYKLDCSLTGQILINALTDDAMNEEVEALWDALCTYIKSLRYSNCDGVIVMEGTCGALNVETDELYHTFNIPFTLFAQF